METWQAWNFDRGRTHAHKAKWSLACLRPCSRRTQKNKEEFACAVLGNIYLCLHALVSPFKYILQESCCASAFCRRERQKAFVRIENKGGRWVRAVLVSESRFCSSARGVLLGICAMLYSWSLLLRKTKHIYFHTLYVLIPYRPEVR